MKPTQTDDVYPLRFITKYKQSPLTYNGLFNSYNHWFIITYQSDQLQSNGSSWVWQPTSAALTGALPMLNCQSPNKPGCVRGLPASAARNDLTPPRTSSRYGLMSRALSWGYLPEKHLTPVNMTHKQLSYTSFLRVVSSTLRLVHIMNNTIFPYDKHFIITQFPPRFYI